MIKIILWIDVNQNDERSLESNFDLMGTKATLGFLLRKYGVPVPRYTSYPTIPFWNAASFDFPGWIDIVKKVFIETNSAKGMSLYVHLPFCESLCTYCACNTRITKNHKVEEGYIRALLQEWEIYTKTFEGKPILRELHLGGGTPTFFSHSNLEFFLKKLLNSVDTHADFEFSFEGHPNNTTLAHLKVLYDNGFRRVSYGVQDLDRKVQKTINRYQPFENVERVVKQSREIGYKSISFDLVYGLPYQTIESITQTMQRVISLGPERIAFYSYAHVPWVKPGQRGYEDADLPNDVEKRALYEMGNIMLREAGYISIGMDHFSIVDDSLAGAFKNGTLQRNFMGYTTSSTDLLIGLGASAISDAKYAYAQNLKSVEDYQRNTLNYELPIFKGHFHSQRDTLVKECIHQITCKGSLEPRLLHLVLDDSALKELLMMQEEGILEISSNGLFITDVGHAFIRNICKVFDESFKINTAHPENTFSKSI